MRISELRKATVEDFPGQDDWFSPFFQVINPPIELFNIALNNNLTLADNFNCEVITKNFTHNTAKRINLSVVKGQIVAVWLGSIDGSYYGTVRFDRVSSTAIDIFIKFDPVPTTTMNATVFILGQ